MFGGHAPMQSYDATSVSMMQHAPLVNEPLGYLPPDEQISMDVRVATLLDDLFFHVTPAQIQAIVSMSDLSQVRLR